MTRLFSDENFPLPVVEELRRLGYDVLTIQETGLANREYPDDQVLTFATAEQRTLLTINRKDFRNLHRQNPNHSGIIICTVDLDFVGQAHRINTQIGQLASLAGQLVRVSRPQK